MFGETEFKVTARLDANGEARTSVTAFTTVGSRPVSVTRDVDDEKVNSAVATALKKALNADLRGELTQEAMSAAAQALQVATTRGEKL
jgi:hypothetical protein